MSANLRTAAAIAVLVAAAGCHGPAVKDHATVPARDPAAPVVPASAFHAHVDRVVDGDTVIAHGAGTVKLRVRLIGIDSPETVKPHTPEQCYGREASRYLAARLTGADVTAAYEPGGQQDRFGRELWDIWLSDGTFVAGEAIDRGFAKAFRVRPQVAYAAYLGAREDLARRERRGLWGGCAQ